MTYNKIHDFFNALTASEDFLKSAANNLGNVKEERTQLLTQEDIDKASVMVGEMSTHVAQIAQLLTHFEKLRQ
jgi:hypothetical protein